MSPPWSTGATIRSLTNGPLSGYPSAYTDDRKSLARMTKSSSLSTLALQRTRLSWDYPDSTALAFWLTSFTRTLSWWSLSHFTSWYCVSSPLRWSTASARLWCSSYSAFTWQKASRSSLGTGTSWSSTRPSCSSSWLYSNSWCSLLGGKTQGSTTSSSIGRTGGGPGSSGSASTSTTNRSILNYCHMLSSSLSLSSYNRTSNTSLPWRGGSCIRQQIWIRIRMVTSRCICKARRVGPLKTTITR